MRKPLAIARQSAAPTGFIGRLLLRFMASETTAFNAEVLAKLAIDHADRVLEVGFGHGRTLAIAAGASPSAVFSGIDVSADAARVAERRCRRWITDGRVELHVGDAAALPWSDGAFTKVFSVHTLYFWNEPARYLDELRRVLQPQGLLVLGYRERSPAAEAKLPPSIYRLYASDQVVELLNSSGFVAETHRASSGDDLQIAVARVS